MVVKCGIIIFPCILTMFMDLIYYFCSGKLLKFEIPAAVKLCAEVWSPDMGLVTAAFKLKRKDIQDRYQHEINRMYAS
jgi:hypothetical protein